MCNDSIICQHHTVIIYSNVGQVKSFVDDLTKERGTVSMRVAFVLRSAEVQPLFYDLCKTSCQFTPSPPIYTPSLPHQAPNLPQDTTHSYNTTTKLIQMPIKKHLRCLPWLANGFMTGNSTRDVHNSCEKVIVTIQKAAFYALHHMKHVLVMIAGWKKKSPPLCLTT